MRLATHIAGGVLAYTVTATLVELPWTATGVVVAGFAAALPDIDTMGSTIGRICAPVARRIERRFGHRTITHCYAAQAVVAVLCLPLIPLGVPHLYAAAVAGYISHPFLDTWTLQGVRVFWPWSDRRGVFPYYNRQETAYRTRTGSRLDSFFGIGFVCLTIPFGVVQHDGYARLVRRVQADASAAVRDFLDWSADGYLVSVAVEANDPQHMRELRGTFDAIGTTGANTLLVRDPETGSTFSLGPAYSANFQPHRVVAQRGEAVSVSRRRIALDGRVLADLESLVPLRADGRRARHLIDGQLTLAEPAHLTPDGFQFETVTGSEKRLSLQFATLADLDRLGLSGLLVEAGTVTLRVFLPAGEAERYDAAGLRSAEVRRVSFAHKPSEPPRLLVAEGDTVAVGDTLAVLASAQLTTAEIDVEDAADALRDVRSDAVPAAYDPVALRTRLAQAQHKAARLAERHAGGFASDAALAAAQSAETDAHAQLVQAEARSAEWRRAHARRSREAQARMRRAELRLSAAQRDAVVIAPTRAAVRRIERRTYGPDRTEVRLVLVAHGAAEPGAAEPGVLVAPTPSPVPLTNASP